MNVFFFILLLFILAALLRIDFFFTILYLAGGAYILARLWAGRMLKHLTVTRTMLDRAFPGEKVAVTLTFENRSYLPIPWLMFNEVLPSALSTPPFFQEVTFLRGKARQTVHYSLTTRQRGYYQIGPLLLETGDLLGLARRLTGRLEPAHLIVYPKVLPLTRLKLPTHSPQVVLATPTPLFQDPNRITGVRSYVQGDNPRHIHWPASATTGQVLVKQFQPAIARDTAIFLNLNRADYSQRRAQADVAIELAIVVAASLANHIVIVDNLAVGLSTSGTDPLLQDQGHFQLLPRQGRGHLMEILEILARVEGADDPEFVERLRSASTQLAWGVTIIVITGSESAELLESLLLLKQSGFPVALVLVQPAAYAYPQTKQAQELGLPLFRIRREQDVEAWIPLA